MSRLPRTLAATLAALALAAPAAWAAESASSASSVASSASVGSVSASVERSSASSSPGGQRAEGAYRVIEVADAADRPGRVRVQLRAVDGDDAFALLLPHETAARVALAAGVVVEARARAHGWQFAVDGEPFFLVVDDDRIDDLARRQLRG